MSAEEENVPAPEPVGFILDDFKRKYSNCPVEEAIPYFWEKFDPSTHSIWFCEYKYNDELGLTFMSGNLISGMFQRIEGMRKIAFSSMCLFGENHKSIIAGIWVWKGQDLAFTSNPDWQVDYEYYDWKKMDPSDEETKKMVELFFKQEGKYKDKEVADGRIFK